MKAPSDPLFKIAVLVVALGTTRSSGQPSPPETEEIHRVQICDIFRDPARYHGLMLEVEGEIQPPNSENGDKLTGQCDTRVNILGYPFPNTLELTSLKFEIGHVGFDFPVDFDWDQASSNLLQQIQRSIDPKSTRVIGTVIGKFQTKVPVERMLTVSQGGELMRVGFGHLGGSPGQIYVSRIAGLRTEAR